jgi:hypothetical protein
VVLFLRIQGEIVKDGERCFALMPKIMQEMVTDGPRALFVVRVGNDFTGKGHPRGREYGTAIVSKAMFVYFYIPTT